MVVKIQVMVFLVVIPPTVDIGYQQCFRGPRCFHLHSENLNLNLPTYFHKISFLQMINIEEDMNHLKKDT